LSPQAIPTSLGHLTGVIDPRPMLPTSLAYFFPRLARRCRRIARGCQGGGCCPHTVMIRGEWSDSFLTDIAVLILPPLSSMSCEIMNLLIHDTAECVPDLPLSKVYSFLDISRKLSRRQALTSP